MTNPTQSPSRPNRRQVLAGTGLALAASGLAVPAIAQERIEWRMVTSWQKNLPGPGVTARRITERIAAASGGRLTVTLYAADELVPALEVLDAVGGDVAEMGHTASFYWQGKHPAVNFFTTVPFGLTPTEHMAWIEHGGGQALWDELYERFGVKPFMAGNPGLNMGGWFRSPPQSIDDLRGLKIRAAGLGGEVYRRLGATALTTPVPEMLTSLQSGVIDAVEFLGPQSDLALGFYKAVKSYAYPGFNKPNGTGECIVNRAAWDGLPDDLKAVVDNACRAENAYSLAEAELANARALTALTGEHDVRPFSFPGDIVAAARTEAEALVAGIGDHDELAARIVASYRTMRNTLADWSGVSVQAYLAARQPA
jgi:TRAP-type mannitol/chloroaromatic compound transport system substrate-binding protein